MYLHSSTCKHILTTRWQQRDVESELDAKQRENCSPGTRGGVRASRFTSWLWGPLSMCSSVSPPRPRAGPMEQEVLLRWQKIETRKEICVVVSRRERRLRAFVVQLAMTVSCCSWLLMLTVFFFFIEICVSVFVFCLFIVSTGYKVVFLKKKAWLKPRPQTSSSSRPCQTCLQCFYASHQHHAGPYPEKHQDQHESELHRGPPRSEGHT